MITLINMTTWENRESVLFQPVLKAYPTHHSWIITAHVSLGNTEKQWKLFTRWMDRTWQLLTSLLWKPLALTQLLSALEAELNSLNSIYNSYQPLIQASTQLLKKEPSFDGVPVSSKHMKGSLLPFLGDTLSWLTGTATTKDINNIKTRINQLNTTKQNQQKTLVHVISILNVISYTTQVNRQHINIIMSAAEKTHQDVTTLYNITHSLYSSLSYQQIVLHIQSILANVWDSLYYMREVTIHNMDYIDAATTGILSRHVLPMEALREMLLHMEEMLPSTMHLPISSEDALHFYRYLWTHILIAHEQFLLLIDVSIQDHAQQMEIYEVFNLDVNHRNISACYSIHNIYLGIMYDETKAVEISEDQFKTCQKANRQLCNLNTLLLPLTNPPACVSASYAKAKASTQKRCSLQIRKTSSISILTSTAPNVLIITSPTTAVPSGITLICPGEAPISVIPQTPIHVLQLQPACRATSDHFHLPPCYKFH